MANACRKRALSSSLVPTPMVAVWTCSRGVEASVGRDGRAGNVSVVRGRAREALRAIAGPVRETNGALTRAGALAADDRAASAGAGAANAGAPSDEATQRPAEPGPNSEIKNQSCSILKMVLNWFQEAPKHGFGAS